VKYSSLGWAQHTNSDAATINNLFILVKVFYYSDNSFSICATSVQSFAITRFCLSRR
jgi:hypothetical protein